MLSSDQRRGTAAARPEIEVEIVRLPPVFVVGERNDRSRLVARLDGRQGISCAPDSDLLTELAALMRRNWPKLCRYGFPEQYWSRRMAMFFDAIQFEYATSRRLVRWAVAAGPADLALIDRLFPRCQVVRVLSDRGPSRTAGRASADPGARRLSARYYQLAAVELVRDPDATLAAVLGFLEDCPGPTPRP